MSTATIETITKMLESLPEPQQKKVADHLKDYLEVLDDEVCWDKSFERTADKLAEFAESARQEIADGKSLPMDFEKL